MFQIVFNKITDRFEISKIIIPDKDAFKNYQFETEENARGVYIHHILIKTKGFDINYIKNKED